MGVAHRGPLAGSPAGVPESGHLLWRRLAEWERLDLWRVLWRRFLGELDQRGLIGWEECFVDGTFAPAKKGDLTSARHARVRARSSWYRSSARVYLSEFAWKLPRWPRSASPSASSPRSRSHVEGRAVRA